jgi:hypothetical protein
VETTVLNYSVTEEDVRNIDVARKVMMKGRAAIKRSKGILTVKHPQDLRLWR